MGQVTWFCTKLGQVTWICKILDQVTWPAQFAQVQITWFLEFEGQVTWFDKIVDQVTWETKCEDQITSTTTLQKWTRLPGRPDYLVAAKSGPDYLVAAWAHGARDGPVSYFLSGPLDAPPPSIVARRTAIGISDSMATTHKQNGTGQLESKLVEDQVPLRCPTALPTCHRACPCPPASHRLRRTLHMRSAAHAARLVANTPTHPTPP